MLLNNSPKLKQNKTKNKQTNITKNPQRNKKRKIKLGYLQPGLATMFFSEVQSWPIYMKSIWSQDPIFYFFSGSSCFTQFLTAARNLCICYILPWGFVLLCFYRFVSVFNNFLLCLQSVAQIHQKWVNSK